MEQKDSLLAKKVGKKRSSFLNSPSSFPKQLRGTNIKSFWELRDICRAAWGRAWKGTVQSSRRALEVFLS